MRDELTVYADLEFEEFDPIAAALDDPELEVPKFTTGEMKWETGRNEVRFFPKRVGHSLFFQIAEHWITTAENKRARYACLSAHGDGDCPICEKAFELQYAGLTDQSKELRPQVKYYALVIDMKRPSFGLQIAQIPWSVYTALVGEKNAPETGFASIYGDFASSKAGYPIFINKTVNGGKTSYSAMANIKAQGPFDLDLLGGKPVPDVMLEKAICKPFEEVRTAVAHLAPARGQRNVALRTTQALPRGK